MTAEQLAEIEARLRAATPGEEWRPVEGYEGVYEVSNMGRVRSLEFRNKAISYRYPEPRILSLGVPKDGYINVSLSNRGRRTTRSISRVVCTAFNGPRPEGTECAHLNGNRYDNRAENLAWVTRKENAAHRWMHGTQQHGEDVHNARFTQAQVIAMRMMYDAGASESEIGKVFNETSERVWNITHRVTWSHVVTPLEVAKSEVAALQIERNRYEDLLKERDAEIARLRSSLKQACTCVTCNGAGEIDVVTGYKDNGPNDPIEVYELDECPECAGQKIGSHVEEATARVLESCR